jgi:hypothetical protein
LAAVYYGIRGYLAQKKRASAWERIKKSSNPVEAFATSIIVPGEVPAAALTSAALDYPKALPAIRCSRFGRKPTQLSLEFAEDEPDTGKGL